MPANYAYKTLESKIEGQCNNIVDRKTAVEGEEYFCGVNGCSHEAKVIFKNRKFRVKYGNGQKHCKLCERLTRFNRVEWKTPYSLEQIMTGDSTKLERQRKKGKL